MFKESRKNRSLTKDFLNLIHTYVYIPTNKDKVFPAEMINDRRKLLQYKKK